MAEKQKKSAAKLFMEVLQALNGPPVTVRVNGELRAGSKLEPSVISRMRERVLADPDMSPSRREKYIDAFEEKFYELGGAESEFLKPFFKGGRTSANVDDRRGLPPMDEAVDMAIRMGVAGGKDDMEPVRQRLDKLPYLMHPDDMEHRQGLVEPQPWASGLGDPTPMVLQGLIRSKVPGRTDRLPTQVPAEAYVIPADVVSGVGQGNTDAGEHLLDQLMDPPDEDMATGGSAPSQRVPVVLAGGEYLVHPATVRRWGNGSVAAGHKALDKFVRSTRKQVAKQMLKLPGPRRD